jgi:hypothetical protein
MEQIGAEFTLLAHLFKIAIRCRNHADIHFDITIFADTEHAAVLQYPQKLCLERCVGFSDLIPRLRLPQTALASVAVGTCEGASPVAKNRSPPTVVMAPQLTATNGPELRFGSNR